MSTNKDLKVGDQVELLETTKWQINNSNNPIGILGEVTYISNSFEVWVKWENDIENCYLKQDSDLRLISRDSTISDNSSNKEMIQSDIDQEQKLRVQELAKMDSMEYLMTGNRLLFSHLMLSMQGNEEKVKRIKHEEQVISNMIKDHFQY